MFSTQGAYPDFQQLLESCRPKPIIFDGVRSDLCSALAEVIFARMQADRGRKVGSLNVGGWKSGEDFFTWPEASVQELCQALIERVGARALIGWAMVNKAGSQHPRHQHRAASLTGIYYVTVGNPGAVTPTAFECPCDARLLQVSPRYTMEVEPHPGRLVVCRGETWHWVTSCSGDQPRITVAFDVRR